MSTPSQFICTTFLGSVVVRVSSIGVVFAVRSAALAAVVAVKRAELVSKTRAFHGSLNFGTKLLPMQSVREWFEPDSILRIEKTKGFIS